MRKRKPKGHKRQPNHAIWSEKDGKPAGAAAKKNNWWPKPQASPLNISPEMAVRLSQMGQITKYVIWRPAPNAPWFVAFPLPGDRQDWLLTRRGEVREFKSLDTAHKACRRIGDKPIGIVDNTPSSV